MSWPIALEVGSRGLAELVKRTHRLPARRAEVALAGGPDTFTASASREGLRLERTKVGDRYVLERMKAGGFNVGGEQSGHIVFADHATTGDPRDMVGEIEQLNHLQGPTIQAGQTLLLPAS